MNLQLKQRIVGAVIGVIFLAIAIPLLFSGSKNKQEHKASPTNQQSNLSTPTAVNVEPTQTKPLELPQNLEQKQTAPTASNASVASTNEPTLQTSLIQKEQELVNNVKKDNNVTTKINNSTDATGNNTTTNKTKQHVKSKNKPIKKPAKIPTESDQAKKAKIPTTSKITKPQQPSPIPTQSPSSHSTAPTKAVTGNKDIDTAAINASTEKEIDTHQKWIIRSAAYHDQTKALQLVNKLNIKNYNATMRKIIIKNKSFYQVTIGPIANKAKAESLAHRIEKSFKIKTKLIPA